MWKKLTKSFLVLEPKVFVSSSYDIFKNLALEDWLYGSLRFKEDINPKPELLLIYRNEPCVVVGRHQNTWVEVGVEEALSKGVPIARRRSGGGTVFHDMGNLNFTFFTPRKLYNRNRNLGYIMRHLKQEYNLDVSLNSRDDILLGKKYKISGTAAKLGGDIAYHHLTLLVDADLSNNSLLKGLKNGIESRATSSTYSPISNIKERNPAITPSLVIKSFVQNFSSMDQKLEEILMDPTKSSAFHGINDLEEELKSWDWIYGRTPKFYIRRHINGDQGNEEVLLTIEKGKIKEVVIKNEESKRVENFENILNVRFWKKDLINKIEQLKTEAKETNFKSIEILKSLINEEKV